MHALLVLQIALCGAPNVALVPPLGGTAADESARSAELANVLSAQEPGATLRLKLHDGNVREGELQHFDARRITLGQLVGPAHHDLSTVPMAYTDVPLDDVEAVWVARSNEAVIGATLGIILGAAAGVGLALGVDSVNSGSSGTMLLLFPLTSAAGGFAGWRIGTAMRSWGKPLWTARPDSTAR